MKLSGKHIEKDGAGYVSLRPENDEDMWHLYNLIQEGDEVRATAIRRIQSTSATGSTESHRKKLMLTIEVLSVNFTPSVGAMATSTSGGSVADVEGAAKSTLAGGTANDTTAALHISGRVSQQVKDVKLGAHHTLDIEANRDVRIIKAHWDSVALSRVDDACVEGRDAEIGAIVCGEGTAAICLLSEHLTTIRQRIDTPVPRKRMGSATAHDKGMTKFYEAIYNAILRHLPVNSLRVIVIASPGFTKDSVFDYIFSEATRQGNKSLITAKPKFVRVHVSSPHVHSLVEALKSPEITSQLRETKFAREGIFLDRFFKMLGSDETRAWYGPDHVALAAERGAVGTLLISDRLFRSGDPKERNRYVDMVETVQQRGGEVLIFSSMHESGEQLNQLSGIAAILTFPLDVELALEDEKAERERLQAEEAEGVEANK